MLRSLMFNNMTEVYIISLFPESIRPYLDTSIMQRAQEKGLFRYELYNLADYSVKNTRRVDDRPYGGGPGMVLRPELFLKAFSKIKIKDKKQTKVILFSCL